MIALDQLQDTERRIMAVAGETIDHGDYRALCAPGSRSWYQANMIELLNPGGEPGGHSDRGTRGARTLANWETVFRTHFDPAVFVHTTLYLSRLEAFGPLLAEIKQVAATEERDKRSDRLHVEDITYRFAGSTALSPALPEGLCVRPVETAADRSDLINFSLAEIADEPWYTTEAAMRKYLEMRLAVTEQVGVRWLRLIKPGSSEILARLGIFEHGGLCRLQAVGTAAPHRRRGYAGALIGHATRLAINEYHTQGLALSVDTGSPAERLYTSLGFETVGHECWVMRFPRENADT
jgi:GNAT superfamily N-acetyltransferase